MCFHASILVAGTDHCKFQVFSMMHLEPLLASYVFNVSKTCIFKYLKGKLQLKSLKFRSNFEALATAFSLNPIFSLTPEEWRYSDASWETINCIMGAIIVWLMNWWNKKNKMAAEGGLAVEQRPECAGDMVKVSMLTYSVVQTQRLTRMQFRGHKLSIFTFFNGIWPFVIMANGGRRGFHPRLLRKF